MLMRRFLKKIEEWISLVYERADLKEYFSLIQREDRK
jgi:hypothetical protein